MCVWPKSEVDVYKFLVKPLLRATSDVLFRAEPKQQNGLVEGHSDRPSNPLGNLRSSSTGHLEV